MGKAAILREAREAVRSGEDRQQVFARFQSQVNRPLHLAVAIASVPRPELKKKYLGANIVLVILLCLAALSKIVMVFALFPTFGILPLLGLSLVGILLPGACAIEAARFNGQMYALIPLFCLMGIIQTALHYNGDLLELVLDSAFLLVIAILSLWIKRKVFPSLGLGGVKKDAQGQFLL